MYIGMSTRVADYGGVGFPTMSIMSAWTVDEIVSFRLSRARWMLEGKWDLGWVERRGGV